MCEFNFSHVLILLSAYGFNSSELSNRQSSAWRKLQLDLNAFADKLTHNVGLAMEFWALRRANFICNFKMLPYVFFKIAWVD